MAKPLLNKAFTVGLLAAAAAVAFIVAFTFFQKGGYSGRDSYTVFAFFGDATGLTWKSRVQIAGIQVGEVEQITLEGQRARLQLRIRKDIDFRADGCLTKRFPSALLPDALLDAVPGSLRAPSLRDLPPEQREVKCVDEGVSVAKLMGSLEKISNDISAVTGELAGTMRGEQGSIRDIIENLARITANLDRTVAESQGKVRAILDSTEALTGTLADVTSRDKERYHAIAKNVEEASARLNDVLASLQDKGELKGAVADARAALEKLNASLEDVKKTTAAIAEGKGVAGKLLTDERLGEKVGNALDGISNYVDRLVKLQLQVDLRSEWLLSQRGAKTYFGLRLLPRPDKYYIFELVNDPRGGSTQTVEVDSSQVNNGPVTTTTTTKQIYDNRLFFSLEFAKRYGPTTFRVGIIESSGGVGADLHLLDDSLKISFNLYQFSRPQTDWARAKLWADYHFLRYFYVTAGADDILTTWRSGRYPGGPRFSVGRDVFFGGGITFTDDDLKTLVSIGGSALGGATSSSGGGGR